MGISKGRQLLSLDVVEAFTCKRHPSPAALSRSVCPTLRNCVHAFLKCRFSCINTIVFFSLHVNKAGADQQQWGQRQTRAGETQRQTDPSCGGPAGERIGGIGEARWGPAVGSTQAPSVSVILCDCVCVFELTATVTENAWCAEAHAVSHEVFSRTKQMHLFSQLKEFANVHIRR